MCVCVFVRESACIWDLFGNVPYITTDQSITEGVYVACVYRRQEMNLFQNTFQEYYFVFLP